MNHKKEDENIIGMWCNGAIQDSDGNWINENVYINKVTPAKKRLSFSEFPSPTIASPLSAPPVQSKPNEPSTPPSITSETNTQITAFMFFESPTTSPSIPAHLSPPQKIPKCIDAKKTSDSFDIVQNVQKPTEATAIGGLKVSQPKQNKAVNTPSAFKVKISPSLAVVPRPTLKMKEANVNDSLEFDSKIESILMQNAAKFTEWLIQNGLVRSEHKCQIHPEVSLKLGKAAKKMFDLEYINLHSYVHASFCYFYRYLFRYIEISTFRWICVDK